MARSGEDRPIDGLPQVSHGQPGRAWYKARWPQVLDLSKPLAFTLLAKPNISITMIWLSMAAILWQPRRTVHCVFPEHYNNELQRDNLNIQLVYVYGKEGGSWGGHASTFYIPQTHLCHLP